MGMQVSTAWARGEASLLRLLGAGDLSSSSTSRARSFTCPHPQMPPVLSATLTPLGSALSPLKW